MVNISVPMQHNFFLQDFDTLFSPDLQFQLRYCVGRQYLVNAQRLKAKVLFEDALNMVKSCSDKVKQSIIHQRAKLHLGVVNRYLFHIKNNMIFLILQSPWKIRCCNSSV